MSTIVTQWLNHVTQTFISGNGINLVASIPINSQHPFYAPLKQGLSTVPLSTINVNALRTQLSNVSPDVEEVVGGVLLGVLKFVKGVEAAGGVEVVLGDFQRLASVYSEANRIYSTSTQEGGYTYPFLNPFILSLAKALVLLSDQASAVSPHPQRSPLSARSIRDTTRQTIEKSMQVASSGMNAGEWEGSTGAEWCVGDIAWALGNILFRIYAARKLHTQATELSRSLSSLSPPEEKRLAARGHVISATDWCQSYYWRGRQGMVLLEIRGPVYWLEKALKFCPEGSVQQQRAILIKLIPIHLLLGKLPTMETLQRYSLPQFVPLVQAYKSGNVGAWRRELDVNREWYRRRSIWLILFERGEILVWRNLFRSSLKQHYALHPSSPKNRCPTSIFVSAARAAFRGTGELEDDRIGLEDVICVISSLIDQSLILGHVSYSQQHLIMKPSQDGMGGFPSISQVTPRRIEAIS